MNNLTTAVHLKLACIRVRADHWGEMDAVAARRGLTKNALMRLLMANAIRAARTEKQLRAILPQKLRNQDAKSVRASKG